MINIGRISSPVPQALLDRALEATQALLNEHKHLGEQQRLEFKRPIWMEFIPALRIVFHDKCAYCESPLLAAGDSYVDHFRPKGSVAEDSRHPGYFWLAYVWRNMLLACGACNGNKRNHFPIGGRRARLPGDALEDEQPELLDPCADEPEEHLRFSPDTGLVEPRSPRGEVTIRILGLNRASLAEARLLAARRWWEQLEVLQRVRSRSLRESALSEFHSDEAPYAAVRRAVVAAFGQTLTGRIRRKRRSQRAAEADELGSARQADSSSTPGGNQPTPTAPRTGYIRRVVIRNFRSIEHVDLTFDYARTEHTGWQVFLGENGVGKSSILQAIAIALIGAGNGTAAYLDPASVLRRLPDEAGEVPAEGSIEVWLDTDNEPIEVTFDNTSFRFKRGAEGARSFVRGFGPTRLLPRRHRSTSTVSGSLAAVPAADPMRQVGNLFDPYVPLCNAAAWLGTLPLEHFNKVAPTIKDVLRYRNEDNLVFDRASDTVKALDPGGVPVSLDLLSHGQQSALVLATDIVAGIMAYRESIGEDAAPNVFRDCSGIILLDEIDAHLHPRWKMGIVTSLKRAFPSIQFIATTHEPLCLRGLDEREIVIVRREDGVVSAEITPVSPRSWRVDQLLTSELFGLFSTIDPALESQFQEYYILLSKQGELSPADAARLEELRVVVQRNNRLGYTRRDQLLYEVIDEYLVDELRTKRSPESRQALREATKQRLRAIWQRVDFVLPPQP